jgi:hypothetical protein
MVGNQQHQANGDATILGPLLDHPASQRHGSNHVLYPATSNSLMYRGSIALQEDDLVVDEMTV